MGEDVAVGHRTFLRLSKTQDHEIWGHSGKTGCTKQCPNGHCVTVHTIITSQIGWIDQRGRVYPLTPVPRDFAGSITPLLVQKDCG